MKYIIMLLCFSVVSALAQNEQSVKHSLSIQLGPIQQKEALLLPRPRVHRGLSFGGQYQYLNNIQNYSNFRIAGCYVRPKTALESTPASLAVSFRSDYIYAYRLWEKGYFSYYLGSEIAAQYQQSAPSTTITHQLGLSIILK